MSDTPFNPLAARLGLPRIADSFPANREPVGYFSAHGRIAAWRRPAWKQSVATRDRTRFPGSYFPVIWFPSQARTSDGVAP